MLVSNLFIILWVKALLKYDFIVTFHYKRGSFVLPINNNLTASRYYYESPSDSFFIGIVWYLNQKIIINNYCGLMSQSY